jgi:polysaccharide biosynthesis protein PslG
VFKGVATERARRAPKTIAALTLLFSALFVAQFAAASSGAQPSGPSGSRASLARKSAHRQSAKFFRKVSSNGPNVKESAWRLWRARKPRPPQPPPPPPPPPVQPETPTSSAYQNRVGMSAHVVWLNNDEQLAYLQRLRAGGVSWIRDDFSWGALERSKGAWNWSITDQLMRNVSTVGINVVAILGYSAPWASSGSTIYHAPRDAAEYANYARMVVERYGVGGTFWLNNPLLTAYPLRAVELWNEPWHREFWRPNPDPVAYGQLVRAAATAIHASHPEMKVLASGDIFQMRADTTASVDWLRLLLDSDPKLFRDLVDGYAVHLYSEGRGPLDQSADQRWRFDRILLTRGLVQARAAEHPIWVTEFGWTTSPGSGSVSEATQATYIRDAFTRTVGEWGSFVPVSFLYHWGKPSAGWDGGFGMLHADGSAKPAWDAISALVR